MNSSLQQHGLMQQLHMVSTESSLARCPCDPNGTNIHHPECVNKDASTTGRRSPSYHPPVRVNSDGYEETYSEFLADARLMYSEGGDIESRLPAHALSLNEFQIPVRKWRVLNGQFWLVSGVWTSSLISTAVALTTIMEDRDNHLANHPSTGQMAWMMTSIVLVLLLGPVLVVLHRRRLSWRGDERMRIKVGLHMARRERDQERARHITSVRSQNQLNHDLQVARFPERANGRLPPTPAAAPAAESRPASYQTAPSTFPPTPSPSPPTTPKPLRLPTPPPRPEPAHFRQEENRASGVSTANTTTASTVAEGEEMGFITHLLGGRRPARSTSTLAQRPQPETPRFVAPPRMQSRGWRGDDVEPRRLSAARIDDNFWRTLSESPINQKRWSRGTETGGEETEMTVFSGYVAYEGT